MIEKPLRFTKVTITSMSLQLTSQEALELTAAFAFTADRMRSAQGSFEIRASICETASRVAFLRAHLIAGREELFPVLGGTFRRAAFVVA
jgi:hypothetical protein